MARQLTRHRTAPIDPDAEGVADDGDYPDEQEETTTTRRSRRPAKDEEEETPTTTRRPAKRRSAASTEPRGGRAANRGWAGAKENKKKRYTGDEFRVDEDTTYLIHFLQPEPFDNLMEHFIKALIGSGNRASHWCLEEDCPLCDDIGDKPAERALFNLAVIDDKGNAANKWWRATPSIIDIIEDYADSERNSPIDRTDLYFEVSKKKGKNKINAYHIDPIRARDLEDDGVDPLTDEELDELREHVFTSEAVLKLSTRKELRDIAEDLED